MNSFYSRFLSHDPLLETDTPVETINPPSQTRQCYITCVVYFEFGIYSHQQTTAMDN
jgi:hypothetical protein